MLKYLHIKRIGQKNYNRDKLVYDNSQLIYLKQLSIDKYEDKFDHLEILLKKTPNLKIFSITSPLYQKEMIAAKYWEYLITTSLPYLEIFNFKFTVIFYENYDLLLAVLKHFQSDFWYKKHNWYSIHEFRDGTARIHTVPYPWDKYHLTFHTEKSCNLLGNNINIFDKVTKLNLHVKAISENYQYYFVNVNSLKLSNYINFSHDVVDFEITTDHILRLKRIMDFSKLKHLCIWEKLTMESSVLLQILKEAPQLSSLFIHKSILMSFLTNNELCGYLNKMICELDINRCYTDYHIRSNELDLFCKTFANLKQLECCINESDDFLFLLDHLPKLTNMKAHCPSRIYCEEVSTKLKQTASKRNILCSIEYR
jgi:hypothetical protein